jgi:hypothetical protein
MGYKKLSVGADRFLALKWANYAFELFQTQGDQDSLYQSLRSYLDSEIEGEETSRKTSNHLKRLWLTQEDPYKPLRLKTLSLPFYKYPEFLPILHLGLAINVFPIYRETTKTIGLLDRVIDPIPKQSVVERVLERFGNTSSIPRAVSRVLQTLEDWHLIQSQDTYLKIVSYDVDDRMIADWLLTALVILYKPLGIAVSDLPLTPEKLGIKLPNPREIIQKSTEVNITRDLQGLEIITIKGL